MEFDALMIAVAVLYLTSIALIVVTVVSGSVRTRRERERARVIKRLRDPVEACVLEGSHCRASRRANWTRCSSWCFATRAWSAAAMPSG